MFVKAGRQSVWHSRHVEIDACTSLDLMTRSLEAVADAGIDIVPRFYSQLFALYPEQEANFHNRASSRGTMVNDMVAMLLAQAEGADWVSMIIRAQVATHHDHGDIALEHYRGTLHLLVDVLAEAAGPAWDDAQERAWRRQAAQLFDLIARFY